MLKIVAIFLVFWHSNIVPIIFSHLYEIFTHGSKTIFGYGYYFQGYKILFYKLSNDKTIIITLMMQNNKFGTLKCLRNFTIISYYDLIVSSLLHYLKVQKTLLRYQLV